MYLECPYCNGRVRQAENWDGPNFCPNCRELFYLPENSQVPPWILGVLTILAANLQIISH
jgi:hypothetical protein